MGAMSWSWYLIPSFSQSLRPSCELHPLESFSGRRMPKTRSGPSARTASAATHAESMPPEMATTRPRLRSFFVTVSRNPSDSSVAFASQSSSSTCLENFICGPLSNPSRRTDRRILSAQLRLEHLPTGPARQRLHEHHVLGHLVRRQRLPAEAPQVVLLHRDAFLAHHHGARRLATQGIRHAHHRDLSHRRVPRELMLHLRGAHPVAPHLEDLLGAAHEEDEAIRVLPRQVAGPKPAILEDGRGLLGRPGSPASRWRLARPGGLSRLSAAPCHPRPRRAARRRESPRRWSQPSRWLAWEVGSSVARWPLSGHT